MDNLTRPQECDPSSNENNVPGLRIWQEDSKLIIKTNTLLAGQHIWYIENVYTNYTMD